MMVDKYGLISPKREAMRNDEVKKKTKFSTYYISLATAESDAIRIISHLPINIEIEIKFSSSDEMQTVVPTNSPDCNISKCRLCIRGKKLY